MTGGAPRRNVALVALLDEVGWSVSRLADEVNQEVGSGYVSRTAASEWVNISRIPRQPLPTVIAHVLSQARGATVNVTHLWPEAAVSRSFIAADHGTKVSWDVAGTRDLASVWLAEDGGPFEVDPRRFMAVSGTALTAPSRQYLKRAKDIPDPSAFDTIFGSRSFSDIKVSPALLEYFRSLIGAFRRMDDLEGGSSENLRQVSNAMGQLSGYLRHGSFDRRGLAKELVGLLAQLGQVGGWMAYDAGRHGLAQRLYRTGLHAAHSVGDRDLAAYIVACLTYQAADRGQSREAAELAEASIQASRGTHPLVRAMVMGWVAHTEAAAGNGHGFQLATEQWRTLLRKAQERGDGPDYLYWLADTADAVEGQAMLQLSLRVSQGVKSLLAAVDGLLAGKISETRQAPRDSLFFAGWLARAHVRRGDLHRGLSLAAGAVGSLPSVASPRARRTLSGLDKDLASLRTGRGLPEVLRLRRQLRPALVV